MFQIDNVIDQEISSPNGPKRTFILIFFHHDSNGFFKRKSVLMSFVFQLLKVSIIYNF